MNKEDSMIRLVFESEICPPTYYIYIFQGKGLSAVVGGLAWQSTE